jgi:hypothetical protein
MKYRVIEEYPKEFAYSTGHIRFYVQFAKQDYFGKDTWHYVIHSDEENWEEPIVFTTMWDAIKFIDERSPTKRRQRVVYESNP